MEMSSPRSGVSRIGEGIRQNRHDRRVFVELAGIDLVEGIGSGVVVVEVNAHLAATLPRCM